METVIAVLFVGGGLALLAHGAFIEPRQRRAQWRRLAAAQGGRAHLAKGWFGQQHDHVLFDCDGVEVRLDCYVRTIGANDAALRQRTRARVEGSDGLRGKIEEKTGLVWLLEEARDGGLGYDILMIMSNDDRWIEARGTETGVMDAHRQRPDLRVQVSEGELTVERIHLEMEDDRVMEQVRLTARYARALAGYGGPRPSS